MKVLILSAFLFFCFYRGIGQSASSKIDSLKIALQNHTTEDSVRLNLLNDLSLKYYRVNSDTGIIISNLAIDLAKKLHDDKKLAIAYKRKGNHFIGSTKFKEGDECFNLSARLFENLGDKIALADVLNDNGVMYISASRYSEAIDLFWRSLRISENMGNESGVAKASGNIGVAYTRMKLYPKAIEFFEKALAAFKKLGNKRNTVIALNNLSSVCLNLIPPENNKALKYAAEAVQIADEIDAKPEKASALNNTARAYKNLKQYQNAIEFFNKSLDISVTNKSKKDMAISYSAIAEIYVDANDSILQLLSIPQNEQYNKALEYQKKGTQFFHELNDVTNESETWQNLSKIYEGQKDYVNALMAYKQYKTLRDSIINNKKIEEILSKEFEYEQSKKEAVLNATHKAEIKQQKTVKNALATGAGILTIGGLISFLFYKRKRDAVQKQKEAEFKTEVSETEMKALRSQMNPHFIFNSLNSIGDYMAKSNTKLADEYLAKFAKLMRLILENSEKKEVALSEDLKALELYMQLESLRMNQKFNYQIKVDEAIDAENTLIPPLILQPFVENSIWHGIAKKEGTGNILVKIKKEGEMINCIIEDDGIGRKLAAIQNEVSKPNQKQSLGMKITKARINILNKVKNSTADVQLFDLAQGTRVEVKLPLELSF